MRVLLTGVTGFVGEAIKLHLLSKGHDVCGVHLRQKTTEFGHDHHHIMADVGSLCAVQKLHAEVRPCDAVIHAAASLNMSLFANDLTHTNCAGVLNLLWLANQWQCQRFVFLSSVPVIGIPKQHPVTEEHNTEPRSAYHASKLFGEHLVRLSEKEGVKGVSLRLTAPVGPRMPRSKLLPTLVSKALTQTPMELSGTGSRKQNYVDVRDIARACELSLAKEVSGVLNIASGNCISNLNLARRCIELCKSKSGIVFNGREDCEDGLEWDVSIDKALQTLGYIPQFNVDDAISSLMTEMVGKTR